MDRLLTLLRLVLGSGDHPKQVHLESCGDKKHQEAPGHRRGLSSKQDVSTITTMDINGDEQNSSKLMKRQWLFTSHVPIDIRCAHTQVSHTQIYIYIRIYI